MGQMDIQLPQQLNAAGLPRWLRDAAEKANRGKRVSDKFLHIELEEQSRMRDAYSSFNRNSAENQDDSNKVQLCGIEKGVKNRYKDILPFEHARVRLQGRDEGSAIMSTLRHIRATRSHKRYIASQGPLPATFEVSQAGEMQPRKVCRLRPVTDMFARTFGR